MEATTTKPAYTVRWKDEENERNLRKLFFAAAADIPDQMLSNLAQPLVCIALKLLEFLRDHRAAHAAGGAYVPPDDAAQDNWMQNDIDLVESVEELDAEFNTQYVKDKIASTTGVGAADRATKRERKRYMLLMKINTLMRDGLLEAVKNKTLLSHIKNKEYVTNEIEALNKFPAIYATRIIPLTCIQLIIDIFTVMAKRGGSGKASFQALCTPPDPSSVSFAAFEKQLLDAKAHLMALRPASAEQVAEIMMATQLHAFLIKGAAEGPQRYQEAYRGVLDAVEQELDKAGQLGPLTLVQMQEFGVKLQTALQSRGLQEVPPKGNPTKSNTATEMAELKTRLRKLETAGGKPPDKPPDKPPPDKQAPAAGFPPRGGARGRARGGGRSRGRGARGALETPSWKCLCCGQVGCKPSTCPKGDPDAQKELANKRAEIEKANRERAARRFQGAVDVSEDEAVSDEENDENCLVSSHTPLTSSRNPDLSSKVSPRFLGTIVTTCRMSMSH